MLFFLVLVMKSDLSSKFYFLTLLALFNVYKSIPIINICKSSENVTQQNFVFPSSLPSGYLNTIKYTILENVEEINCRLNCCNNIRCSTILYNRENKTCTSYECKMNKFQLCLPVLQNDKKYLNSTLYYLRFPEHLVKDGFTLPLTKEKEPVTKSTVGPHENRTTTSKPMIIPTGAHSLEPIRLIVNVGKNKTIYLPKDSVVLRANVVNQTGKFDYEWELVSKPQALNVGRLTGKNNNELELNNLIQGEYQFKVSVRDSKSFGDASVFVFVKPAKKKNEPPVAIIKPPFQIVQLPNNIILDGSGSTDDNKIVSYHWETIGSPIDMEKNMKDDQPMLQLDKNIIAGNYTFKLTVKDEEGQTNFTTASLTVYPEKDYPPKSDPGPNMIVNLPHNSVILNGSGSTDDKKIVSFEWSKTSDSPTVDIQGSTEPILRLSKLQKGTYTFNLKVIDSSGQISEKEVKVFVKPRLNVLPTVKASVTPDKQITVRLPATEAILNGSLSSDDDKIIKYQWEQISGTPKLNFIDGDKPVAYVHDLMVGVFQFQLTVMDSDNQLGSDIVTLRVEESQNQSPKAIVKEKHEVHYMDPDLITIDGSKSWDDHKIVSYQWFREDESLAVGDILANSNSKSVLLLTGLLPGAYKFKFTVFDEEGLSHSASTSLVVLPSKLERYFVELQSVCSLNNFTESKMNTFLSSIQLILQKKVDTDSSRVQINLVKMEAVPFTNRFSMVFYAMLSQKSMSSNNVLPTRAAISMRSALESNSETNMDTTTSSPTLTYIDAILVLEALNEVRHDSMALTYPLLRVDTYVCQNNCSNHGKCNTVTRLCECDSFWVNSFLRDRFGDGRPNCDWSIIYLVILSLCVVIIFILLIWIGFWIKRRRFKNKKTTKVRKHKYMRLNEYDPKYKLDSNSKLPKSLTNGVNSRNYPEKESSNLADTDSNMSSDVEETMFINNRIVTPSSLLPPPSVNGQAMKSL